MKVKETKMKMKKKMMKKQKNHAKSVVRAPFVLSPIMSSSDDDSDFEKELSVDPFKKSKPKASSQSTTADTHSDDPFLSPESGCGVQLSSEETSEETSEQTTSEQTTSIQTWRLAPPPPRGVFGRQARAD